MTNDCAHGVPMHLICGACGPSPADIAATLQERGARYGAFTKHASVTQDIKRALFDCRHRESLAPDQVEALEMIAHKLGRIVNGDPDYADSWVDIAGYAKLVADRLLTGARLTCPPTPPATPTRATTARLWWTV